MNTTGEVSTIASTVLNREKRLRNPVCPPTPEGLAQTTINVRAKLKQSGPLSACPSPSKQLWPSAHSSGLKHKPSASVTLKFSRVTPKTVAPKTDQVQVLAAGEEHTLQIASTHTPSAPPAHTTKYARPHSESPNKRSITLQRYQSPVKDAAESCECSGDDSKDPAFRWRGRHGYLRPL